MGEALESFVHVQHNLQSLSLSLSLSLRVCVCVCVCVRACAAMRVG